MEQAGDGTGSVHATNCNYLFFPVKAGFLVHGFSGNLPTCVLLLDLFI